MELALQHSLKGVAIPRALLSKPDRFKGRCVGDCVTGDLIFENDRPPALRPTTVPDHKLRLLLPKFAECHVHLDKCFTFYRVQNAGGDLAAAIAAQFADKANWTAEDLSQRATRAIAALVASGCGAVRSHVDWSSGADAATPPLSWRVLSELAEHHRGEIQLQLAALVSAEDLVEPDVAEKIGQSCAEAKGVLGAFIHNQPQQSAALEAAFDIAQQYDLALDFHVDEGLSQDLAGLEAIADLILARQHKGPVLCGHACSLANLRGEDLHRILRKVAAAGISIVALPTTNLYLQGRHAGTPDRRGITRLREMQEMGINIALGTDNVQDAFYPLGTFNPLATLALGVAAAHLDPPFGDQLRLITTGAHRAMGLSKGFIDQALPHELNLYPVSTTAELLSHSGAINPLPVLPKGAFT